MRPIILAAIAAIAAISADVVLSGVSSPAAAADATRIERHWARQVEADWRTPNPEYAPGGSEPQEYGIRYEFGPNGQTVTGELSGVFSTDEGERRAPYWRFFSYVDPATDGIVFLQIGWNGAVGAGRFIDTGDDAIDERLIQTFTAPDGSTSELRHDTVWTSETERRSSVFGRDEAGEWALQQEWIWTRQE
ncbi:MAG: hypothetical protein GC152_08295 [Alphaproteobacteria bacterium]|nr:hypothetical protein [Alphaproteobacteria bacterium]